MKRDAFLEHVAWTGAGIAFAMSAEGLLAGKALADVGPDADTLFVQISDSHLGFHMPANPDVLGTFNNSIDAINQLAKQPRFVIHTGDVSHLSTPEQFDSGKQALGRLRVRYMAIPGEHDMLGDHKLFYDAFPAASGSTGWFSWEESGIHYIALVNVFDFENMGLLGSEQLAWLERDLRSVKSSTPVVVFAHVPLYALYPQWGWTTRDGAKALALLAPFDRVTVLNGHIHQVIHHVEGNIHFATAHSTAYPQAAPGKAPHPGPLKLPHGDLLHVLGFRSVTIAHGAADLNEHTLG